MRIHIQKAKGNNSGRRKKIMPGNNVDLTQGMRGPEKSNCIGKGLFFLLF